MWALGLFATQEVHEVETRLFQGPRREAFPISVTVGCLQAALFCGWNLSRGVPPSTLILTHESGQLIPNWKNVILIPQFVLWPKKSTFFVPAEFEEPRVIDLWDLAKSANFSKDELDSLRVSWRCRHLLCGMKVLGWCRECCSVGLRPVGSFPSFFQAWHDQGFWVCSIAGKGWLLLQLAVSPS